MRETLTLIAKITARPEGVAAMEELLMKLAAASRAEAGCLSYAVTRVVGESNAFLLVEEWTDAAALELHNQTPHVRDAFQTPHVRDAFVRAAPLLASMPEMNRYKMAP